MKPQNVAIEAEWKGIKEAIKGLVRLDLEADRAFVAASFKLADSVRDHLRTAPRSANGWPRDPNRREGEHSADLWQAGEIIDGAVLYNPADYASDVHKQPRYGGPVPLAFREDSGPLAELELQGYLLENDLEAFISDLLRGRSGGR